jgi:hypothetical protein
MAAYPDLSGLTLNTQEALSANEAVFEKVFLDETDITRSHIIETGIQMKTQIVLFGRMGLVGKKSAGDCSRNEVSGPAASEKVWDPELISWSLIHCQEEINQLFKMWKRAASALDTWEQVDNEQIAYITDSSVDAGIEAIMRITSLADVNSSAAGSGAGNEELTAGTDETYFNMLNGFWKQIFTAVTATTVERYTITENGLATKALQLDLASDRSITMLRDMYNNADARLLNDPNVQYSMTRSLYNNYLDWLEDKSVVFTLSEVKEGVNSLSYRGIPIVVRNDWDRNIREYYDNGTTYYFPHRCWLSTPDNMRIGTSDDGDFTEFSSHYSKDTRKHYIDQAMYLDAKLIEEYMVYAAY